MPPAPVVGSGVLNSVDLKQKIITNVEQVIGWITGLAPQHTGIPFFSLNLL